MDGAALHRNTSTHIHFHCSSHWAVFCAQLPFQLFPEPSVTVLPAQLQQQLEKFIIKNAQSKWILLGTVQLQTAVASVHLWIVCLSKLRTQN